MIKQTYNKIKERYPNMNMIVLFRIGDEYKAYYEDANTVSGILKTPVVNNNFMGEEWLSTAFPHEKIDKYLPLLVRHGYRIAICD